MDEEARQPAEAQGVEVGIKMIYQARIWRVIRCIHKGAMCVTPAPRVRDRVANRPDSGTII
jgi:hypothetical protein